MRRANKGVAEDSKAPSAGAKSLCIPFDQEQYGPFPDGEAQKCVQCGKKAKSWTLFGRSELRWELIGRAGADVQATRRYIVGMVVRRSRVERPLRRTDRGSGIAGHHSVIQ